MNVRKHRGIENLLLRRVRRHQSMTALFRAPDAADGRPRATQARPVVQKQEQESPVDVPVAEVIPSLPVTPARSNAVARQALPPSESKHLTPAPSTPASEPAKTPDPVWKRLQTIFRKHEEHNDPQTADVETSSTESIQTRAHEEKEPLQATATEEHTLPTRSQDVTAPEAKSIQRSSENVEPKSEPASLDIQRKVQSLPSTSLEARKSEPAHSIEAKPVLPDKGTDISDQGSTNDEPEKPALPLESVWNVQRVEEQHPLFHEHIPHPILDSTNADGNKTSIETSPVREQKRTIGPVQRQQEDDPSTEAQISDSLPTVEQREEPREPVEILAPSRPRPPQTDLPSKSTSIQRQSQDHPASNEVSEAPPVNTAIGPLPADLWWLLGQKPPAAAPASQSQPDIQRTIQPDQKQAPLEQSHISNPHTPAEQPVETPILPNTIQRQALSQDPPPSHGQEPANSARAEESKRAEPDLDDLVRRVYAEIRHRLAAERERRR